MSLSYSSFSYPLKLKTDTHTHTHTHTLPVDIVVGRNTAQLCALGADMGLNLNFMTY